jgi:hypothetical protein
MTPKQYQLDWTFGNTFWTKSNILSALVVPIFVV